MMRFCAACHEQARHLGTSTPEYGTGGASRSRPSWAYTKLLCCRLSCTAARLGLATGGIPRKLDQFHLRCLRKVLRVSWKEHVLNQEILRWAELTGIEAMLNQAQLRWSGHVTRIDNSRLPKQLFHAKLSTGIGTKAGRGSGTKTCWNQPSRPATSQLTSGKPWPRTGWPGGQLYARARSTLREADCRAWMIWDRQGRTECQTLALLYLVSSAARSALPLSGSKLICANTSTDTSSSYSKDYYYLIFSPLILNVIVWSVPWIFLLTLKFCI